MSQIQKKVFYQPGEVSEQDWMLESDLVEYVRRGEVRQLHLSGNEDGKWTLYVLLLYRRAFMVVRTVRGSIRGFASIDKLMSSLVRLGDGKVPPLTISV